MKRLFAQFSSVALRLGQVLKVVSNLGALFVTFLALFTADFSETEQAVLICAVVLYLLCIGWFVRQSAPVYQRNAWLSVGGHLLGLLLSLVSAGLFFAVGADFLELAQSELRYFRNTGQFDPDYTTFIVEPIIILYTLASICYVLPTLNVSRDHYRAYR